MMAFTEPFFRPRSGRAHLNQLQVKTDIIAPGVINGGGIHVMDKPAGIEEGSVIIPYDSPAYRDFVIFMILSTIPEPEATPQLEEIRQQLKQLPLPNEFSQFQQTLAQNSELKKWQGQIKSNYQQI